MRYIGRDNIRKMIEAWPVQTTTSYCDGSASFELAAETVTVRPPFALSHESDYDQLETGPLYEALFADRLVAVLLVRLGGYAVGVFAGEELVASKVGSRFVKNRHKKGGSSANRFRRRREEQAKDLHEEAAAVAERVLLPYEDRLDAFAVGGSEEAIRQVLAASKRLGELGPPLPRFLPSEEPRLRVLERVPYDLYAAQIERQPR